MHNLIPRKFSGWPMDSNEKTHSQADSLTAAWVRMKNLIPHRITGWYIGSDGKQIPADSLVGI